MLLINGVLFPIPVIEWYNLVLLIKPFENVCIADPDEVENIHLNYCSDTSTVDYLKNSWQTDFLPVAIDLISRLELKMNRFEPL